MNILISNASDRPIYEQIYRQIRDQIISGGLREGDLLPSIRTLAKDLRISVITTKRAYDELEKDGYINTVSAKGSYVAPKDTMLIREEHLRQMENEMRDILGLAQPLGLSREEIFRMMQVLMEEERYECN